MLESIINRFDEWATGKIWYFRLIVLIIMLYLSYKIISSDDYYSLFSGINLAFHEMGHIIFRFGGDIVTALGGTIMQLLIPIAAMIVFIKTPDFTGIPFSLLWLSSNLFYVSWYMRDASSMELPLVSIGGGDAYHDWNYLFNHWGILGKEIMISNIILYSAYGIMILSIALMCLMLIRIYKVNKD